MMVTTKVGLTAEAFETLHGTLDTVLGVLDGVGIPSGLFFGTLLGTVRTGDFLPWDSDADLIVVRDDFANAYTALSSLQGCGYETCRVSDRLMTVRARTRNVQVDIFCADPRPDGRWEVRGWPPFMWSGVWSRLPLRGRPYPVPHHPNDVLRCVYGIGWVVPFADHWAALYAKDVLPADPSSFAVEVAGRFKNDGIRSVLDFGCGNGRDAAYFAEQGFRVTACDPMHEAAEAAERLFIGKGLSGDAMPTLLRASTDDWTDLPHVDAVYLRFVLHAVQRVSAERIVCGSVGRLRPGGVVAAEVRSTAGGYVAQPLHDGGYLVDGHYRRPMSMGELHGLLSSAGYVDIVIVQAQSVCGDDVADTWRAFARRPMAEGE